jgi:hypothetical protein
MPKLAVLALQGVLRNDDIVTLSRSGLFANLRALSLQTNEIGDNGVLAIANGPCAAGLRVLRLGDNKFGEGGLAAIARPGAFPNLTTLDLNSSLKRKASAYDVTRFLATLEMPRLRHLDLRGWPVDDSGARAIATYPAFANLTCLNLGYCHIGPKGITALFDSPNLRHLMRLDLDFAKLGNTIEALLNPDVLPNLRRCDVSYGAVSDDLKERIMAARNDLFI